MNAFPGRKLDLSHGTEKLFQIDYVLEEVLRGSEIRFRKTGSVTVLTKNDALEALMLAKRNILSGVDKARDVVAFSIVNVFCAGENAP
jgi:hypothetical protein